MSIVFTRIGITGSGSTIQLMGIDGSNIKVITPVGLPVGEAGTYNLWPSVSPDGKSILFTNGSATARIAVMNADGSGAHFLTLPSSATITGPCYSPDGSRIAFSSSDNGPADLFDIPAGGGTARRLTTVGNVGSNAAIHPRYNSAGTMIVYEYSHLDTALGMPPIHDIYTISSDGVGMPQQITTDGKSFAPCFSSSGKIIFISKRDGTSELYSMNSDGTSPVNLSNTHKVGAEFTDPDSR